MNHVLPILEELKGELRVPSSGISMNVTQDPPHVLTKLLGKHTFEEMEKIKYHDVVCGVLSPSWTEIIPLPT